MRYCQSCGKRAADNDIVCSDPQCRGHLDSHPPTPTPMMVHDIDAIAKRVWSRLWKKHFLFIFGEFSILMLIGVIGLIWSYIGATMEVKQLIATKIDGEFKTERIRATIADVASERASNILQQQVQPAVKKLTNDIAAFSVKIDDLSKTKEQQENEIGTLNRDLRHSETIESNLQNTIADAKQALKELNEQSDFITTVIAADHDDRKAFENLTNWGLNPSFKFQLPAQKVVSQIMTYYYKYNGSWSVVQWDALYDGQNRNVWNMAQIISNWFAIPGNTAKDYVDFVAGQTNITDEERYCFLRNVCMKDSRNSLYAAHQAATTLADKLKANYNPDFKYDDIEKHWREYTTTNHLFLTSTNDTTNTVYDIIQASDTNRVIQLRTWGGTKLLLFKLKYPPVPETCVGKAMEYDFGTSMPIKLSDKEHKNCVLAVFNFPTLNFNEIKYEFKYERNNAGKNVESIEVGTNSIAFDHSMELDIPPP
jgi:hypothetical protein